MIVAGHSELTLHTGLCLVLIAIGIGIVRYGSYLRALCRQSLSWPRAQGVVEEAGVRVKEYRVRRQLNIRYEPFVKYRYMVAGSSRYGSKISFAMKSTYAKRSDAEKIVLSYGVGTQVQVSYDPASDVSLLEPGNEEGVPPWVRLGWAWIVVGAGLFLAAVVHP